MDEIVLNKAETVERAITRVKETYKKNKAQLNQNIDAQDIIVLNLQRTCEAMIDIAMHLVRKHKLGLPKSSADGFFLLSKAGHMSEQHAEKMRRMIGFRNIAVHDYQSLDWDVLVSIIERELDEILVLLSSIMKKEVGEL